jgi:YebC/PmpR family DNA-binding regulatory protein
MTKDTIERAVQRGAGGLEGENLEEVRFEGYGPGGIAIIVESMTDNNNRTDAEVRHAFTKSGGNLGTNGSVSYLFEKKGIITVSANQDADQIMEISIEAGAEDLEINDDKTVTVSSTPEISLIPENTIQADLDTSLKAYKLLEMLEDLDDTQSVTSNIEFAEGMMDQLD